MADLPTGTVTFLLTDIEGSTTLWECTPEAMREARCDAIVEVCVAHHRGRVIKSRGEGDSYFIVFAQARDAVAAACVLQQALRREPWPTPAPLRMRMALHTGEADFRSGDYYGRAVNRCARLRALAHGGQTLVSLATQEIVVDQLPPGVELRDLGVHSLKDLSRPEHIFQLLTRDVTTEFPPLPPAPRPNDLASIACLYFSLSTAADETRPPLFFTDEVIYIGRPGEQEAGPTFIDLELPSVSRHHARISRQGTTYILENWEGKYGIGVYERRLDPGDAHTLRHSDVFRIPDQASEHIKCLFLIHDGTQKLPLHIEEQTRDIYVFGDVVKFTPLEYRLVEYLYKRKGMTCDYGSIISYLWPDGFGEDRKRDLEVLLVKVRKKIRDASGGFSFMQTIRGHGVRLVI